MALVLFVAPYKILRYIMPVIPIFIITLFSITESANIKNFYKYAMYFILSIGCLLTNTNKIENFKSKYYIENVNINRVILAYNTPWKLSAVIPYINDDISILSVSKCEDINKNINSNFEYVIVQKELSDICKLHEESKLYNIKNVPFGFLYSVKPQN